MSIASEATFERRPEEDAVAFRLQRGFRALLDAMARPGELCDLGGLAPDVASEAERMGLMPTTVSLLDVLLDGQTSFCVVGDEGDRASREVSLRTHAHIRASEEAAFCIVPRDAEKDAVTSAIAALTPGTLISPQLGATVVVECGALIGTDREGKRAGSASGAAPRGLWELSGPGVNGTSRLECDRADVIDAAIARADEFPCGIDLVLIDGAGHLAAIPRSSKVHALGNAREEGQWAM